MDRAVLAAYDRKVLVNRVVNRRLLHEPEGEDFQALVDDRRRTRRRGPRIAWIIGLDPARGKRAEGVVIGLQRQTELLQVVGALGTAGRLACGLDSGEEQADLAAR